MHVDTAAHAFFVRMATGYRATKVLLVATRIGAFDHLETWRTAEQLAERVRCDPRNLKILMHALAAMEVLEHDGERFRNTSLANTHLVSTKEGFVGHNLAFQDMLWECWSNLETVVRSGKPHRRLGELLADKDPEFTRAYIRGMLPIAAGPAEEVTRLLSDRPIKRMLDVGGGPGAYAMAVLAANPKARATILDLPTTLEVTKQTTAKDANVERLELRPGNYLSDDYGADYDLVLMSHVTHDEGRESVINMASRAFKALKPGGRLAIHDWKLNDVSRADSLAQALFGVNVMVYTEGQVYSEHEYRDMLNSVGFVEVKSSAVLPGKVTNPTYLIVGLKPG